MKLKVALVTWIDSEAANEWSAVDEISDELDTTYTVGFLIKECDLFILMALSYDPSTQSINSYKKIPRLAVINIKMLKQIEI